MFLSIGSTVCFVLDQSRLIYCMLLSKCTGFFTHADVWSHSCHVGMQAVMHQLLSMGAVNGLPEDLQWAIRMLLPRKEEAKTAASEASTKTTAAEAALSQLVPPTAYLPYLLQPQQLAVLTQHAQQVACCTLLACARLLSLHLLVKAMLHVRNVHVWYMCMFGISTCLCWNYTVELHLDHAKK